MAACVTLAALVLYVLTVAPTTQFWDTSEYIAAAYVLGIPHPPGNPLFTIIAHTWGLLPLAAGYAMRINLLAAATSAVAAGCWFLVGERLMRAWVPAVWPRQLAALAGAICAATAFTVWNQSVVNEKVYTLSLLSVALVLWLILRWDDQPLGEAHDHHLLLIVYLIALTATNHMMGVLVGPVVVVLLFPPLRSVRPVDEASRRVEWSQWFVFCSVYGMIVATGLESATPLFAVGVLFLAAFANAILRARNWDFAVAVLAVAVVGLSVYLFLPIRAAHYPPINEGEPTTWKALWEVLTRQQYGKPPVSQRQASLVAQIGMWVQYFSWQWGRDWMGGLQRGLAVVFASLGLLGAWRHWKADRRAALAMTALMATFTLLLIALIPLAGNRLTASRAGETLARDFAFDILQSAEPYGVLVTAGDNDTFPLWYAQEVEGIRKDVTVVNLSLANTDWYLRQLQRRPVFEFDSTRAPTIYRGRAWPKPRSPVLSYSSEQLETLQPYYVLDQKTTVNLGPLSVTLDPQILGRTYLERADVVVLQAIKDNVGRRPFYFSRTVGLYADQFGFTAYLEGQGFARKLWDRPITPSDSIKAIQALGYVNLPRTTKLVFDVYHGDTAARSRPRGWVDRPSEGIPALYGLTLQALAQTLRQTNPQLATRALVLADSIFKNTSYGFAPPAER